MREVEEVMKEEGLWAGLNRPMISIENASLVFKAIRRR